MTRLSEVQIAVLRELAEGYSQDRIAEHMAVSINTTKSRISAISDKLHTKGAAHSVAMAYARGYLQAPMEGEPSPKLPLDQVQIMVLVARGKDNTEICETLGLTKYQVKYRLKKMFETLGAKNDCHLVSLGFQTRNLIMRSKRQPEE